MYKKHSFEEKLRRKERHYASESEKASVRVEIMEKSLPLSEICLKYNIFEGAIYSWRKTEGKVKPSLHTSYEPF